MSLKIGRSIRVVRFLRSLRRFTGSIVVRMTAWYAGTSFVLILITTILLYWTLATNFAAEDKRSLENTANDLRLLLHNSGDSTLIKSGLSGPASTFQKPQEIWVRLLRPNGKVEIQTHGMDQWLPVNVFPPVTAVQAGHDITRDVQYPSGKSFQTVSTLIPQGYGILDAHILQIAMDRSGERLLLIHYRERLLFVLIISLALCSAIGFAIARNGMRPVKRIIGSAKNIRSSTLHERIAIEGLPIELLSLAETFNEMLVRLEQSFEQVSQFSADVAHELRTPINNLQGEIEVALGKSRSTEDYREVLESALEECMRLRKVIQSLLFLARSEMAEESPHVEPVNIRHQIAAVIEFYEASAAEAGVSLIMESGEDEIIAYFDRTLLQQAIGNLVDNAIAHTDVGGHIILRVSHDLVTLRIEVTDTGRGIAPEHLPHVLSRFYRADPARPSTTGNLGLGLAMVRSIAVLHGGRVMVDSEVGIGTSVIMETLMTNTFVDRKKDFL